MPILTLPSEMPAAEAGRAEAARSAAVARCKIFTGTSPYGQSSAEMPMLALGPRMNGRLDHFVSLTRPAVGGHAHMVPAFAARLTVTLARRHGNSSFCAELRWLAAAEAGHQFALGLPSTYWLRLMGTRPIPS